MNLSMTTPAATPSPTFSAIFLTIGSLYFLDICLKIHNFALTKFSCEMKKSLNKFRAKYDASTWGLMVFVVAVCVWPLVLGFDWRILTVSVICVATCMLPFFSTWYAVDGDELIVAQFCMQSRFPIMKIKEIKPTKSMLASPATSLTGRIAISFTDRKVMKSSSPLVISPANKAALYQTLLSINPEIHITE